MPKLKITAAQIIALRSATMRDNGSYELTTAKGQTVNALTRSGILVSGTRFLTVQGVSVMHSVSDVSVIASKGHTTYVSDSPESLELFTLAERESDTVEIQGDEPSTWTPDFDAVGASECYFGCGSDVVAVFVDYVGRTEGVCVAHRERVEGRTYELPTVPVVDAHTDAESVSSDQGEDVTPFVFVPGTHALDMGSKGYNRFCGIGESSGVPGSLYTHGLATAISAHPGMGGTGKVNIPCEFGDVITVRTSIGDRRYVVEFKRHGDPVLTPYATDDAKCFVCQAHGDNSLPGKNIDGEWVCGYCAASERTPANLNSHTLVFYVETERAGTKFECTECRSIDTRANFAEWVCEGDESPIHNAFKNDETEDAGFVETDSVEDYAIVSRLTTGAGIHTVPDAPQGTGTTHHSMDAHGGQWERFEHVLSVGDIVRSTETGRALYEVYALIPGLPVVYVDPCDGREPFPMGATKLYAL